MSMSILNVTGLDEFDNALPRFQRLSLQDARPFWSVMIPTYNRPEFLAQTLASVLAQDPGPEQMQIQVCDNCSDVADIEKLVKSIGKGRVQYFRHTHPVINNMNSCIDRSVGKWTHILHDDDVVLPGFYSAYRATIESDPDLVMIAGRCIVTDVNLKWLRISGILPGDNNNRLDQFVDNLAFSSNPVCFASTVVRRDAYENVGGFSHSLTYSGDWEMWVRVGLYGPVAGMAQPYSLVRTHSSQDSANRGGSGIIAEDFYRGICINRERLIRSGRHVTNIDCRLAAAQESQKQAWTRDSMGCTEGRLNYARLAWRFKPNVRSFSFLLRSWLKNRIKMFNKK